MAGVDAAPAGPEAAGHQRDAARRGHAQGSDSAAERAADLEAGFVVAGVGSR